jgi:hypothetical protein
MQTMAQKKTAGVAIGHRRETTSILFDLASPGESPVPCDVLMAILDRQESPVNSHIDH